MDPTMPPASPLADVPYYPPAPYQPPLPGRLGFVIRLAGTNPWLAALVVIAMFAVVVVHRVKKADHLPPTPVTVSAAAAQDRGPLVNLVIRQSVMKKLMDGGLSRAEARRAAFEALQDETINTVAGDVFATEGPVQGSVLDWILAHKDQIAEIVKILIALLALFA